MAKYVYPAVFTKDENGQYSVNFPDIPHCYTGADNLAEAVEMAQDVLAMTLYEAEEKKSAVSEASDVIAVKHKANEIVSLIACDTDEYRRMYQNKAIKKTLTIPAWLNTAAEKQSINFSQVLQEALVQRLGL